jgi:SAM-dependent methyltransferase
MTNMVKFRALVFTLAKPFISMMLPHEFFMLQKGQCTCCDNEVQFFSENSWLRDHFKCPLCKSIPRERALMLILEKYFPNWRNLSIHESSPINRGASAKLKNECRKYISSHFFPGEKTGVEVSGFRNENLENQTFQSETFDLVITQDVMEHIYAPDKAFSEISRTLRMGGAHVFTVPLVNKFKPTQRWAHKGENGEPLFLYEPDYHGNPIDPSGSPVTMHWGYDIVDYIKESSRLTTTIEYIDDLRYGIRAEYNEVLISRKG